MKKGRLRKLLTAVSAALMILSIFGAPVFAEFVFKKDGSIIKGSIVKDYPGSISVKNDKGDVEQVKRTDIMRINYTELYLGKVYARLTSGEVVEGYQVDEDRDNYFFRKDIANPEEFKIQRKKVMFIAHTNPTDVKGNPSTNFINMSWSPPFKPAKFYRVYLRDVKNNEETFRNSGETVESEYTLNNLIKSWTYELYATAIADSGEESLPSEKIIVSTRPEPPGNLILNEELSQDGRTVTLTFRWENVTDPDSRVKGWGAGGKSNYQYYGGGGFSQSVFSATAGDVIHIVVGTGGGKTINASMPALRGGSWGGGGSLIALYRDAVFTLKYCSGGGGESSGAGGGPAGEGRDGGWFGSPVYGGSNGVGGYGNLSYGTDMPLTSSTLKGFNGDGGGNGDVCGGGGGYGGGGLTRNDWIGTIFTAGGGGGYCEGNGSSTVTGSGSTPGNNTDPDLPSGFAVGGIEGANGGDGYVIVSIIYH